MGAYRHPLLYQTKIAISKNRHFEFSKRSSKSIFFLNEIVEVIHHFALDLQYGLVRLGTFSFSNLESLIHHFAQFPIHNSGVLLRNPVAPANLATPKRVRCKFPYTAAPDTDELTVQHGEILIVHQGMVVTQYFLKAGF